MEAPAQRWKPLTPEQIDDMVEAFNELQVTGHFTAMIGQSGNIAVEIREQVIDPDTLAFILDVADRHSLRPYIFRTEHNAPIVLQPLREQADPGEQPEVDVDSFDIDDDGRVVPIRPDGQPAEPGEPDETFYVQELPNAILLTLPVEGLAEDDWPAAHFAFETASERDLAREVVSQAGQLAAARVNAGTPPAQALAEAYELGTRAFEKAKTTLTGAADA
jgi:hypothetical protein